MLRFLPSYQAVESMRQGNYLANLVLEGFGTIHICQPGYQFSRRSGPKENLKLWGT